jgi:hypothetical protein
MQIVLLAINNVSRQQALLRLSSRLPPLPTTVNRLSAEQRARQSSPGRTDIVARTRPITVTPCPSPARDYEYYERNQGWHPHVHYKGGIGTA